MRHIIGLLGVLIIGWSLSGCVSASKYKNLESKSRSLENEVMNLKAEKETLELSSESSKSQYENLLGQLQEEVKEGQLKVTQYKNMLSVDLAEKIFFDSGKATLKESGKEVLKKVGQAIAPMQDKFIRVVGHTDNVPMARSLQKTIPTNWELSVLRATNVVRFLQEEAAIAPERLIPTGRGQHDPIAPNTTPEGRQQNRRIEIMLINKDVLESMGESRPQQPSQEAPHHPPADGTDEKKDDQGG